MDFAAQLNVSLANGWGIVRTVADLCLKMPEGKYVLVKDPNKVRFHSISFLAYFSACFAVAGHVEKDMCEASGLIPMAMGTLANGADVESIPSLNVDGLSVFVAGYPIVCRPTLGIYRRRRRRGRRGLRGRSGALTLHVFRSVVAFTASSYSMTVWGLRQTFFMRSDSNAAITCRN
jgi:hypothetical protein